MTSTQDAGGGTPDGGAPADAAPAGDATTPPPPGGATAITGKLGALGTVLPTVSSLVISNSGETLIYFSSAALTCEAIKASRWLGTAAAGSQVIEVVIKGAPKVGSVDVPPGEVNYAQGGKSSSYEVSADSGTITFTKAAAQGVVEGTVTAAYADGSSITGSFHAEFCAGGQGY